MDYTLESRFAWRLFHRPPPPSPLPSLSLSPPPSSPPPLLPPPLSSSPRFLVIYPGAPASGLSAISARSRPVIINAANYSANSLAYLVSPWASYSRFSHGSHLPLACPPNEFTTFEKERERERETEKERKGRS